MGILLVILKKYWPYIVISLLVVGFYTRYKVVLAERDHYQTKSEQLQEQLSKIQTANAELERLNADTTKRFENALKSYDDLVKVNADNIEKRIKDEKLLASIKLPDVAVELFNQSVTGTSKGKATTPTPEGTPATAASAGNSTGTDESKEGAVSASTLQDLLAVANRNNEKAKLCYERYNKWNAFWDETNGNFKAVESDQ